ncbi:MAG TPA: ABC transporter ATP-binding protein [Candidatus Dormibacteraeota bacterium]|nr:ABC transporter ATP-binding protein [Candidatus Dormibacteraeota bacterium]
MSLLSVEGLRVRYGAVEAVHGIDFRLDEGEVVAMLGPNGAGKTSTLRALIGLLPGTGHIAFDGKPIGATSRERVAAGLALVPEGREIFLRLTVRENILMGAYLRSDREIDRDLQQTLQLFPNLAERLDSRAVVLSGGEQQMLAIARAIMGRPRLLMLDEPSMGLAPRIVTEVFHVLRRLVAAGNITILLVEQNANLALRLATRAYLLERGRIAMEGPSAELISAREIRTTYLGIEASAVQP